MTREEAIRMFTKHLEHWNRLKEMDFGDVCDRPIEALDMAIEALTVYDKLTCKACADRTLCIMSAPDGNWKACKDYRPLTDDTQTTTTIPMFKESEEAYKAWTGEEIGGRSEQYKKGFEDAKRAFEIEYAREAESMLKKNAELNMLVNVQRELLADRPHGEWIQSEIPNEKWVCSNCGGACWYYDGFGKLGKSNYCPNCGALMGGDGE